MDCPAFLGISESLGLQDPLLTSTNCCTFNTTMVQCDEQNYIWFLRFRRTGFKGSIPANIDQLTRLQVLSLVGNEYTGTIPPSLGNIKSLTTIWLRDNLFTGSIPDTLSTLPSLDYFDISGTDIQGPIPDFLLAKNLSASRIDGCPYDTKQCGAQPNKPLRNPGCASVCVSTPTSVASLESPSNGPNLALILPLSIIGGLALIAIAIGGFLLYKRKNRSFRSFPRNDSVKKPFANDAQPQPESSLDGSRVGTIDLAVPEAAVVPTVLTTMEPQVAPALDTTQYAIYYPVIQNGQTVLYPSLDGLEIPHATLDFSQDVPQNDFTRITAADLDIEEKEEEIPAEYAHLYPPKKSKNFFEKFVDGLK